MHANIKTDNKPIAQQYAHMDVHRLTTYCQMSIPCSIIDQRDCYVHSFALTYLSNRSTMKNLVTIVFLFIFGTI